MDKVVGSFQVKSADDKAFGVNHLYHIWPNMEGPHKIVDLPTIRFQKGPIRENDINGITEECLIEILIDRLKAFQKTKFANRFNREALNNLYAVRGNLNDRTAERNVRGVEGLNRV